MYMMYMMYMMYTSRSLCNQLHDSTPISISKSNTRAKAKMERRLV